MKAGTFKHSVEKPSVFENSFVCDRAFETEDLLGIVNEWVEIENDNEVIFSMIENELDKIAAGEFIRWGRRRM